ncbi:hypothetical protein [Helicobacter felis]|uniref:hypothetical protein n=1 Tax=Helicobacter felis TaxID=214 RepID=UPI001F442382|nr:hypothetical protein [Helicobacter felis]
MRCLLNVYGGGWVTKNLLKIALVGACALSGVQAKAHHHAPSPRPSFVTINPQSFGICEIPETHYYENALDKDTRVTYFETGTGTISCSIGDAAWVGTDEDGKPTLKRTKDYWYSKLIGHYIIYKKRGNYYAVISFNKLHLLGTPENEAIDLGENNVWGVFKADKYMHKPLTMKEVGIIGTLLGGTLLDRGDKDFKHLKKISTTHLPSDYARAFETYAQKIQESQRQRKKVDLFNDHPKTDVITAFPQLIQEAYNDKGVTLFWINKGIRVSGQDVQNMTELAKYQQMWEEDCNYLEQDKARLNQAAEDILHSPLQGALAHVTDGFAVQQRRKILFAQQTTCDGYKNAIKQLQGRN